MSNKYKPHVSAAIQRLGYVSAEAIDVIAELLWESQGMHPHAVARLFRSKGRLLDKAELRAVGLRANTIMSHEAMATLTDKGREKPIAALDGIFLDAAFNFIRQRGVERFQEAGYDTFKVDAVAPDCPACKRLHGLEVNGAYIQHLPPKDCSRDGCMAMLAGHIDFYAGLT
ncbi:MULTISPECIES: hypothetical protein [unclassified Brevundimonas]|uniref:hypothetical protein n=1 Tax=unclassified Brevundimonas TaxID=2622653 RepID=UPI0025C219E0|nr:MULTISPECIES: hypothetical protein [unclassified Brevundimonas]